MSTNQLTLPEFDCHKRVRAAKIVDVMLVEDPKGASLVLDNGQATPVDLAWIDKHTPSPGGYFVVYQDGYTSFSPAEAFESGYSPASGDETGGSDEVSPALVKANQRIASLEAALRSSNERSYRPPTGATIPGETVVRIGALPFRLAADAFVEGSQIHVNEALEDLHADDAARKAAGPGVSGGVTGAGDIARPQGTNPPPGRLVPTHGDALQKFLGDRVGHPLTLKVLPIQPGEPDHASVRIASVDQASAIEGRVIGNVFFPKG